MSARSSPRLGKTASSPLISHAQGGFFKRFADGGALGRLIVIHESRRQRPQSRAGFNPALYQQDFAAALNEDDHSNLGVKEDRLLTGGAKGSQPPGVLAHLQRAAALGAEVGAAAHARARLRIDNRLALA